MKCSPGGARSRESPHLGCHVGRIVLRCGTEPDSIYIVPTLGGLPKKIAEGAWPKFSPDGSRIAYVGPVSGAAGSRSL